MSIRLKNISVESNGNRILKNINLEFIKNSINIIMGPSGAGKTTLLNSIMHVNNSQYSTSGKIEYDKTKSNSFQLYKEYVQTYFAYVSQSDNLLPSLTVYETIYYSFKLRYNLSDTLIKQKTFNLIKLLNLEKCALSKVGDHSSKYLSGGEMKRLSIAVELTASVELLILDEPTSGLDTYSALSVMHALSNLTQSGVTVICTVHQPSSDITNMFQNYTLISDGCIVYNGDYNKSVKYFNELMAGHGYEGIDQESNPVDVYMRWMSNAIDEDDLEYNNYANVLRVIKEEWEKMDVYNYNQLMVKDYSMWNRFNVEQMGQSGMGSESQSGSYGKGKGMGLKLGMASDIYENDDLNMKLLTDWNVKLYLLFKYCFVLEIKNYVSLALKLMQNVFLALTYILFYQKLSKDDLAGFMDRTGLFFIILSAGLFGNLMPTLQKLFKDKAIVIKETKKNMYQPWQWLIVQNLIILFTNSIGFSLLILTMYYPLNLNFSDGWSNMLNTYLIYLLIGEFAVSVAQLLVCFGDMFFQVQPALQILVQPLMLTSGLFARLDSMSFIFGYIKWVNPLSYAYSAFVRNELMDNEMCVKEAVYIREQCDVEVLGVLDTTIQHDILMMLVIVVVWRVAGFLLFEWHIKNKSLY
eukprot:Mrub_01308.p1 GENE.Mrub_01308~~Mrub_01308.p1  ORF type:complete len:637 (+),score=121.09 Mrub_01308:3-1913(+)